MPWTTQSQTNTGGQMVLPGPRGRPTFGTPVSGGITPEQREELQRQYILRTGAAPMSGDMHQLQYIQNLLSPYFQSLPK